MKNLFRNIFKKKENINHREVQLETQQESVDMRSRFLEEETHEIYYDKGLPHIIVDSSELTYPVMDEDKDYFYEKSGYRPKEDYRQLILDSQEYFEDVLNGRVSINDGNVFIYEYSALPLSGDDKIIYHKTSRPPHVNAKTTYIGENAVCVIKDKNGYRRCGSDGRHRYVAARELKDVKLLVRLMG